MQYSHLYIVVYIKANYKLFSMKIIVLLLVSFCQVSPHLGSTPEYNMAYANYHL